MTAQRALLGGSEFQLAWAGTASGYQVSIGTVQGGADVGVGETTAPTYAWQSPRAGTFFASVVAKTETGYGPPSTGLTLVSVDLRDVIEAMLYSSGPLSETRRVSSGDFAFSVWPDGRHVNVLVAPDVAEISRIRVEEFVAQYATITNHAVTGTVVVTQDDMKGWGVSQVPPNSVAVRFMTPMEMEQAGTCTVRPGVGCNSGGPPAPGCGCATANVGRSITTLHTPDADYIKHELGHAYGMFHIFLPSGTHLPRTLMGPGLAGPGAPPGPGGGAHDDISETEVAAIVALRERGFGKGGRRSQLVAAGLINP